jgi:ZIP family zinc transporter/zinc and cadmium transporter
VTPLAFALVAAAANIAGGYAVVRHLRRSLRLIDVFIAFGAGFMIAVAVLGMLPEVFAANHDGGWLVLAGYLLVHLTQHVLTPHFHFGEETHRVSASAGVSALLGLSLHTFFDGVAIASGFLVSSELGLLLFLAVLLHKLPEGVTISSVILAGGQSTARALSAAAVIGLATILGVVLTELVEPLARSGLAIAAGVTLYVAASNLVPEIQSRRGGAAAIAFFGGAAGFFVTHALLERWIG